MKKRYILTAFILLSVVFDLFLYLPRVKQKNPIAADSFFKTVNSPDRSLSTDIVAKRMINGDPVILLVDVRTQEDFGGYSLPGAVNIPLKDLLLDDWEPYLNQDARNIIFYSNGNVLSEQAWSICRGYGYANLYILDGGLDKWFATILQPEIPDETASTVEFDLFAFRTGAAIYFGSEVTEAAGAKSDSPVKK